MQLHFDPAVVSFTELLTVFWDRINPTTLNQQGNDVGSQYRSGTHVHVYETHDQQEECIVGILPISLLSRD